MKRLRSYQFRRERQEGWRQYEKLLAEVDRLGAKKVGLARIVELIMLHRWTTSSLSVARATSLDRNLLEYLQGLVSRGHAVICGIQSRHQRTRPRRWAEQCTGSLAEGRKYLAVAAGVYVLGFIIGWNLISQQLIDIKAVHNTTQSAYVSLYSPSKNIPGFRLDESLQLLTEAPRMGFLAVALGFLGGIPTLFLSFYFGMTMGSWGAIFARTGEQWRFWSSVALDQAPQIGAFLLCCAAGLMIGEAELFPGRRTRIESLVSRRTPIIYLILFATLLFLAAGVIQLVFSRIGQSFRLVLGIGGILLLLVLLFQSKPPSEDTHG